MNEQLRLTPARRFSRPPSGSEELHAADLAGWRGVTVAWVYAETRADRIPHIPVGRHYCYRPSSIEAWLREQEHR